MNKITSFIVAGVSIGLLGIGLCDGIPDSANGTYSLDKYAWTLIGIGGSVLIGLIIRPFFEGRPVNRKNRG